MSNACPERAESALKGVETNEQNSLKSNALDSLLISTKSTGHLLLVLGLNTLCRGTSKKEVQEPPVTVKTQNQLYGESEFFVEAEGCLDVLLAVDYFT